MKYQLSIIQFPSGRFGFVGSVPKDLAIRHRDNRTLSDAEFKEYSQSSNPAMQKRIKNYVEPVFNSRDEAHEFARESGFELGIPLIAPEAFAGILDAITSNAETKS